MSNIENFIRNHRSEFDDLEPEPGHFERFAARLNVNRKEGITGLNRPFLMKIAAVLLLLLTITVFIFDLKTRSVRSRLGIEVASNEIPSDVNEAMQYYDGQAIRQLNEIGKLAKPGQQVEVNRTARLEMQSLDDNTTDLKKALSENPDNERILEALIQNQQMKERVTSTILLQLNQLKNKY